MSENEQVGGVNESFEPVAQQMVATLSGVGRRQLVAASQIGRAHLKKGGQREDSVLLQVAAGWNILALADGATPVQFPLQASNVAVAAASAQLAASLWQHGSLVSVGTMREVMLAAVQAGRDALEREAERRKVGVRTFDTTLLLLAHQPDNNMVAVASIGDGALAALLADDTIAYLGHPTVPIRHLTATGLDDWRKLICVYDTWPSPPRLCALFSDGVSNDYDKPPAKMGALLRDCANLPTATAGPRLLALISYLEGSDDDRTIALILPQVAQEVL